MTILIILHSSASQGGANVSGLNMLRELRHAGYDVRVLLPTEGPLCRRLEDECIDYKVIYFRQAWPYTIGSITSWLKFVPRKMLEWKVNRRAVREIERWVAEEVKPDLIHSNSSVTNVGAIVARRLGLPHVTHFREYGFRDTGFPMWHVRRMLRSPLQFNIAVSEDIAKFHHLPEGQSVVIYNGIYSRKSYPESPDCLPKKDNYLLYVGGLYHAKGVEDILEAYSGLDPQLRHQYPLRFAGSANSVAYGEYLKKRTLELGISETVEWLGEREDVADLMQNANALIVASQAEAFGRIMAEAAFNRCLVIARDKGGLHEQFEQGRRVTGQEIGLRFGSVDQLTSILNRLLTDDISCYEDMINAGYVTARTLYTNEANGESVSDFYNYLMQVASDK